MIEAVQYAMIGKTALGFAARGGAGGRPREDMVVVGRGVVSCCKGVIGGVEELSNCKRGGKRSDMSRRVYREVVIRVL